MSDNSVKYATIKMFERYKNILTDVCFENKSNKNKECSIDNLIWMCDTILENSDDYSIDKMNRWLGFIQGVLAVHDIISVEDERNFSRELFHAAYKEAEIEIPKTKNMIESLIDEVGSKIYFDKKSNYLNKRENIDYLVAFPREPEFYVRLHREDGPACIDDDGTEEYWFNGKQHREDGPAVIWADGSEEYYVCGLRHREDGPAHIYSDGTGCLDDDDIEWCLDDKEYPFEEWCKILNKSEEEINFLKLKWNIS